MRRNASDDLRDTMLFHHPWLCRDLGGLWLKCHTYPQPIIHSHVCVSAYSNNRKLFEAFCAFVAFAALAALAPCWGEVDGWRGRRLQRAIEAAVEEEFDVLQGCVFGSTNGVFGSSAKKKIHILLYLVPSQAYPVPLLWTNCTKRVSGSIACCIRF